MLPVPRCPEKVPPLRWRLGEQRGQALVETGLVVVFLVFLFGGIVEMGRAWMILNMVTHACRDGARAAAVAPSTNRDGNGMLDSGTITAVQTQVLNEIQSVMDPSTLSTPAVTQSTSSGIPVVTVRVTGTVPYVFGFFGASLAVNRSATFRDEGR